MCSLVTPAGLGAQFSSSGLSFLFTQLLKFQKISWGVEKKTHTLCAWVFVKCNSLLLVEGRRHSLPSTPPPIAPITQSGHFLYAAIPGNYENLRKPIILACFDSEPLTSEDLFLDLELLKWQRKTWYNCTTAFSA